MIRSSCDQSIKILEGMKSEKTSPKVRMLKYKLEFEDTEVVVKLSYN